MSLFHAESLALLMKPLKPQPTPELDAWAAEHDVTLPEAFTDWAALDGGLFERIGLSHTFLFHAPELLDLPDDGRPLLMFERESQGNYRKGMLLNGDDDPPVFFAWLGREPWIQCTSTFSECVYNYLFDYQYALERDDDGFPNVAETGQVNALDAWSFHRALPAVWAPAGAASSTVLNRGVTLERRYRTPSDLRLVAREAPDGTVSAQIFAPREGRAKAVSAAEEAILLRLAHADSVKRPVRLPWLLQELGAALRAEHPARIRHRVTVEPTEDAIAALAELHAEQPLVDRISEPPRGTPPGWHDVIVGGVHLRFLRHANTWMSLHQIELSRR